jgi:hypothetical protein
MESNSRVWMHIDVDALEVEEFTERCWRVESQISRGDYRAFSSKVEEGLLEHCDRAWCDKCDGENKATRSPELIKNRPEHRVAIGI